MYSVLLQGAPQFPPINIQLPQVNWPQLIPNLVGLFFDAIGTWITTTINGAFSGLWAINPVTSTPLNMTWGMPAVQGAIADIQLASKAVLACALVLVALRCILGVVVPRWAHPTADFVDSILASVVATAAFPVLVPMLIGLLNQSTQAIASQANIATLATPGLPTMPPMVQGMLLLVLLFFGLRLVIKSVWRIGFLAVLLPIGIAACILYAIPTLRWLLGWWARTWGGMLLAQAPVVFALATGVALASTAGLSAFVYSIAFLQLATDLYSILPFGHPTGGGPPWAGMPFKAGYWMAAGSPAGGASAAAASTLARTEARYPWPAGATAESMATQYGYQ